MSVCMVYITASSMDEAENIGQKLVSERLVACVNLIPGMKSIYHWKGDIDTAEEIIIIAKTRQVNVNRIISRVNELHSYECPCIITIPITAGNDLFINWIINETE